MRVLVVARHPDHRGGVVASVQLLLPHLGPQTTRLVVGRRPGERWTGIPRALAGVLAVRARRRDHDLLHLNTSLRPRALARDAALLEAWGGGPALVWVHGWDSRFAERFVRAGGPSRLMDRHPGLHLATVGERFRHELLNAGCRPDRVHLVRVPVPPFAPPAGDPRDVLFLGRLVHAKGPSRLLEAFARLAGRHPGRRLVLAGEGPLASALDRRATALGLRDRVDLPGWVVGAPKAALWSRAAAFALPSSDEALPAALLEAMGAGVPAICTEVGAVGELLTPDSGWPLADPGVDALTAALAEVLGNPDEARRRAVVARARAAECRVDLVAAVLRRTYSLAVGETAA